MQEIIRQRLDSDYLLVAGNLSEKVTKMIQIVNKQYTKHTYCA